MVGDSVVRRLAALTVLLSFAACGQPGPIPASRHSVEIEPRADLEAGPGCTPQLAVAKVNALFAGLNHGDAETVASMFPEPDDGFVIQPELEIIELQEKATTPDEVRRAVRRIAGLHFVFTEPLQGWAKRVDYVSPGHSVSVWTAGVGPLDWKATGGGRSYSGRGKIAFNCETGRFIRVGF